MVACFAGPSTSSSHDAENEHCPTPPTLLHQDGELGPKLGDKARIVDPQFSASQRFGVNCAVVRRSSSSHDDLPPSSSSPSLSGGAIGGIAACVVISVLLILLGVFIWHRRERNKDDSSTSNHVREIRKSECSFETAPVVHHTPSLPALPPLRIPSPSDSAMVSVSPIESDSDVGGDSTFPFSGGHSGTRSVPYGSSADEERGTTIESGSGTVHSKYVAQGFGEVNREQRLGAVPSLLYPPVTTFDGDPSGWRKSLRPLPRPRITLTDSSQYRSSLPNLQNVRMEVKGRVQDFGPAAGPKSFLVVSNPTLHPDDDNDLPPPDYYQATQPFPDPMSVSLPVSPSSDGPPLSP